jgi:hypothetical protein
LISSIATPIVRILFGYAIAFALPAVLMFIALVALVSGRRSYRFDIQHSISLSSSRFTFCSTLRTICYLTCSVCEGWNITCHIYPTNHSPTSLQYIYLTPSIPFNSLSLSALPLSICEGMSRLRATSPPPLWECSHVARGHGGEESIHSLPVLMAQWGSMG